MRKFATSLLAIVLAGIGLVAGTSTSAQAYECPYTGCYGTQTTVEGPNRARAGTRPTFSVTVEAIGSNATVEGTVKVTFTKARSGRTVPGKTVTETYDGGTITVKPAAPLGRGVWIVTAKFRSADGPFYPSQDFTTINMIERR